MQEISTVQFPGLYGLI